MSKSLKMPLFVGVALVVVVFVGFIVFSEGETESPPTEEQPTNMVAQDDSDQPMPYDFLHEYTEPASNPELIGMPSESPTSLPTRPVESTPGQTTQPSVINYEIQPGDVISRIAVKHGCKSRDIYDLNEGLDSKTAMKIRPGQVIKVADKRGVGSNTEVEHVSKPTKAQPKVTTPKPMTSGLRKHKLSAGDTIFTLSQKYYGSPKYFIAIRNANPSWDPTSPIEEGREISIPSINGEKAVVSLGSHISGSRSRNPIPPRR